MKYKLLCVAAVVVMLAVAGMISFVEMPTNRYHQHLEALEKEACTDHGEDVFCTHLPLLKITTEEEIPSPFVLDESGDKVLDEEGYEIRNEEMVISTVEYFDSKTKNNHLSDSAVFSEKAWIRIRGASSRNFDKNNYLLKFVEDNLTDSLDVSFSGMTADNEWALHGPFMDKTLLRNYLCYNLAGEIMDYAPNIRFCEVFLNDAYVGIYLIVEKVTYNDSGRIHLEQTDPDLAATSYIVQMDRGTQEPLESITTFASKAYIATKPGENQGQFEIVYPGSTLTEAQRRYIENDLSKFEKALYSFDYKDRNKGYMHYIDMESFVHFFLINEFTLNYDAIGLSTFLYKDIGGKLKFCVWDFNSAFDYYEYSVITPETFLMQTTRWFNYLFKDENFVNQVVSEYKRLRKTYFSEEYLYQYIDETIAYLGPAIERNYEVWGYSFQSEYNGKNYDYLIPVERNVRSYEEAIAQLKECIRIRIEHMDANVERLYILSHDSLNKKYNRNSEGK